MPPFVLYLIFAIHHYMRSLLSLFRVIISVGMSALWHSSQPHLPTPGGAEFPLGKGLWSRGTARGLPDSPAPQENVSSVPSVGVWVPNSPVQSSVTLPRASVTSLFVSLPTPVRAPVHSTASELTPYGPPLPSERGDSVKKKARLAPTSSSSAASTSDHTTTTTPASATASTKSAIATGTATAYEPYALLPEEAAVLSLGPHSSSRDSITAARDGDPVRFPGISAEKLGLYLALLLSLGAPASAARPPPAPGRGHAGQRAGGQGGGWLLPRPGLRFGGDWALYPCDPRAGHSAAIVRAVPPPILFEIPSQHQQDHTLERQQQQQQSQQQQLQQCQQQGQQQGQQELGGLLGHCRGCGCPTPAPAAANALLAAAAAALTASAAAVDSDTMKVGGNGVRENVRGGARGSGKKKAPALQIVAAAAAAAVGKTPIPPPPQTSTFSLTCKGVTVGMVTAAGGWAVAQARARAALSVGKKPIDAILLAPLCLNCQKILMPHGEEESEGEVVAYTTGRFRL